ncbi:DUF1059 domain-containing protein [Streptomyces sp. NPDC004647]|uniref:DUF1059 domain-containing protein n=1 Tax=Streptomyces sp. NPDC004647 TaxID=3154671 RepID=UPI0033B3517F
MARKVADCRRFPSEMNCSLTISGEEEEVVRAAAEHAVSVHRHTDGPELRQEIRALLEDELIPAVPKSGPPPPEGEIFDL